MLNNVERNVRASISFHSDEKSPVVYVTVSQKTTRQVHCSKKPHLMSTYHCWTINMSLLISLNNHRKNRDYLVHATLLQISLLSVSSVMRILVWGSFLKGYLEMNMMAFTSYQLIIHCCRASICQLVYTWHPTSHS